MSKSSVFRDEQLKEQVIRGLLQNNSIRKIARNIEVSASVIYRIIEKYKLHNVWVDELKRCKLPNSHPLSGKEAEIISLFYKGITIKELALVADVSEDIMTETISKWKLIRSGDIRCENPDILLRQSIIQDFSNGLSRQQVAKHLGISIEELVSDMEKFNIDDQPEKYVVIKSLHPLSAFYGQEQELKDLMAQGYLQSDIAKMFKVTSQTVSNTVKKLGLQRKHHYYTYRLKKDLSFENMLMNNETIADISKEIGIRNYIVSNNIKRNHLREAFDINTTPIINRKEDILDLAKRGLNYEQIGKIVHRHPVALSKLMSQESFHIEKNIKTRNKKIKFNAGIALKGKEAKILELLNKEFSRKKVAEKLGVSITTLSKKLRLMNIPSALHSSLSGKEEIITKYFNEGLTYAEIGKILGCHALTVSTFIKKLNLTRAHKDVKKATKISKHDEVIRKLYAEGLSVKSISDKIGCSEGCLHQYLKKIGLSRSFSEVKRQFILDGKQPEIQKMLNEGYKALQISEYLGCSVNSVYKAIKIWELAHA